MEVLNRCLIFVRNHRQSSNEDSSAVFTASNLAIGFSEFVLNDSYRITANQYDNSSRDFTSVIHLAIDCYEGKFMCELEMKVSNFEAQTISATDRFRK